MLVRHYIRQRLADYYAQPATAVVGSTKSTSSHNKWWSSWLFGEWHWQSSYNQLLRQHDGQWLTPVELFQPYYSNTIANFIMRQQQASNYSNNHSAAGNNCVSKSSSNRDNSSDTKNSEQHVVPSSSSSSSAASATTSDNTSNTNVVNTTTTNNDQRCIEIIELGGGRGTNAQLILDQIYHTDRLVYNQIASYTMIDSSPTLHDYQKQHLSSNNEQQHVETNNENGRIDHSSKMKFRCIDIVDIAEGRVPFFIRDDQELGNDDDNKENNHDRINATTNKGPIVNNKNDNFATSNKTSMSHNNNGSNNRRQQRKQQQQKEPKQQQQQQQQQQIQTYIIACELLDNLPHDKISIQSVGGRTIIKQAELVPLLDDTTTNDDDDNSNEDDSNFGRSNNSDTNMEKKEKYFKEVFRPLSDELLKSILQIEPMEYNSDRNKSKNKNRYATRNNIQWIPTIAYGLLQQIYKEPSQNRSINIVLADFDQLPFPDNIKQFRMINNKDTITNTRSSFYAQNEPLVTCMDKHDYECYLQSPYLCDILYPTNFDNLSQFILSNYTINKYWNLNKKNNRKNDKNNSLAHHVRVLKQSEFLQQYGPEQIEMTKSWLTGYTPLLHDYCNCSVLTVTSNNNNCHNNGSTGKE